MILLNFENDYSYTSCKYTKNKLFDARMELKFYSTEGFVLDKIDNCEILSLQNWAFSEKRVSL